MRNSIKKMVLTAVAVTMMVAGLAAPAMAEEQQPPRQSSVAPAPAVAAPNDPVPSDPVNPQTTKAPADEEPLKDPGIRQCDITPPGCQDTDDDSQDEEPLKDPGIRQCDITPTACPDADGPLAEHGNNPGADTDADDPSPVEEDEKPLKDPGIRQCDITPTACPDAEDSSDDQGHTSDADADANEANPVEKEESKEAVSAPDEAGQIANSNPDIQGGCAFDHEYDAEYDVCVPPDFGGGIIPMIVGDEPWPDSAGGYIGLPGDTVGDMLTTVGIGLQIGVGKYVEEGLVKYGEALPGPVGWPFQGLGYTLGFAGDAAGTILSGAGEIVRDASDVVGDAVDAVGDAAEDAWDTVSGWF